MVHGPISGSETRLLQEQSALALIVHFVLYKKSKIHIIVVLKIRAPKIFIALKIRYSTSSSKCALQRYSSFSCGQVGTLLCSVIYPVHHSSTTSVDRMVRSTFLSILANVVTASVLEIMLSVSGLLGRPTADGCRAHAISDLGQSGVFRIDETVDVCQGFRYCR